MTQPNIRVNLKLKPAIHGLLKIHCVKNGLTIQGAIEAMIRQSILPKKGGK